MPKITKRLIDAIDPESKDVIIRDNELKGFICKITPMGRKVYMLYYRTKDGRERKPAIGIHGNISCEQARNIALVWLSEVAKGNDPSVQKKLAKTTLTAAELAIRYLEEHANVYKKRISIKNDKSLLKNHILPAIGQVKINSLTAQDIVKFHYNLRNKPIAANRCLSILSKMFSLCEKWGIRSDAGSLCKHVAKYTEIKREKFLSR